jgi:MYXO-CTERM domain-containing protein
MTPIEVEADDRPPQPAADCGVGAAPAGAVGAIVGLAALAALVRRRHSTRRTGPT